MSAPPQSFIAAYEPDRKRGPAPASEIRTATRSDATALALLEQGVRPGDVEARIASLSDAIEDPEQLVVLASVGSEPAGWPGSGGGAAGLDLAALRRGVVLHTQNLASLALHETFGFVEVDRGSSFQAITFTGGVGVLLRALRPVTHDVSARRGSAGG